MNCINSFATIRAGLWLRIHLYSATIRLTLARSLQDVHQCLQIAMLCICYYRELEDSLYNLTSYQTEFCQMNAPPSNPTAHCIRPTSVLRYFDGTFRHLDPVFYDPAFDNITQVLLAASTNPSTAKDFLYFLGKGYRISAVEAYSEVTRTSIPLGLIFNLTDAKLYDAFLQDDLKPVIEEFSKDLQDGLRVNYYSDLLFSYDTLRQALYDMMLALGSLSFIFIFILFQTRWVKRSSNSLS